jgi:hypothetical protein
MYATQKQEHDHQLAAERARARDQRLGATDDTILREAMIALHGVLADLEADIAEETQVAESTPSVARHHNARQLVELWENQHFKLAQFFDWDVYLHPVDRAISVAA